MLYLFSQMPATNQIKAKVVSECQRLIAEFQTYVMETRSLRKVFFSIKGIYYQAEIKGQTVTWIVPYQFVQTVPTDVDFRVMLTFLEFYTTLMGFVNFRLYSEINQTYPPQLDEEMRQVKLDKSPADMAAERDAAAAAELDEFESAAPDTEENKEEADAFRAIQQQTSEVKSLGNLFSNSVVFLSRETPRHALEFMIRSCGGQVSWDETTGAGAPFPETHERITHQVSDRPKIRNRVLNRAYVQPQWVADCINARKLLATKYFEPGQELPPHLSPFVEYKEGDYKPSAGIESEEEEEEEEATNAPQTEEDADETYQEELEAEAKGITFSEYNKDESTEKAEKPKKKTAEEIEEEERKQMASVMMNKKTKRLYSSMVKEQERDKKYNEKLQRKKKQLKTK